MADREGNLYCDLNLKWKYKEGCDDVSMQNYVRVAINNIIFSTLCYLLTSTLIHAAPNRPQYSTHAWLAPTYGQQSPQLSTKTKRKPTLNLKK